MTDATTRGPFKRIGSHPVADFINTVSGRVAGSRRAGRDFADTILAERLEHFDDLLRWAAEGRLLGGAEIRRIGQRPARARSEALRRALQLREALYRLFKAAIEAWPPQPADLAILTRVAEQARGAERLHRAHDRPVWVLPADGNPDGISRIVALSAVELLASADLGRVRQCPGERCGWLFVDTSRNGSRQWCDMGDCGNIAKVRRFRARQ